MEEIILITYCYLYQSFEAELAKGLLEDSGFHPNLLNERIMVCMLQLQEICIK